jgi:hypothetical protein
MLARSHLNKTSQAWWYTPVLSSMPERQDALVRRIMVKARMGQKARPYLKNNLKVKRAGDLVHVVECKS